LNSDVRRDSEFGGPPTTHPLKISTQKKLGKSIEDVRKIRDIIKEKIEKLIQNL